ncbi:MAG: hypothetical protein AAFV25_08125 [Bacteroidota bacterium]
MPSFEESGLQFVFGADWWVKKFDEHRYYKWLSGSGLKGVDFIGINAQQQLILMEVKNYRRRNSKQSPEHLVPDVDHLSQAFVEKVMDSRRVIRTVVRYLNRKWWYRPALRLSKWLAPSVRWRWDGYFWQLADQLLSDASQRVVLVLWLEEAALVKAQRGSIRSALEASIRQQLADEYFQVKVLTKGQSTIEGVEVQFSSLPS